jgi:hypothetical protein
MWKTSNGLNMTKKQQKDALIDNAKEIVTKWWTEEIKVSPNVKDVVCQLVSTKTCEKHIAHFLQKNQVNVFTFQFIFS